MRTRDLKVGEEYAFLSGKYAGLRKAKLLAFAAGTSGVVSIRAERSEWGWHAGTEDLLVRPITLLRTWAAQEEIIADRQRMRDLKWEEANRIAAWFDEMDVHPRVDLDEEDPPGFKITFWGKDADFIIEAVQDWLT